MKTAVVGFPRVGKNRELKFATEKYFKGEISEQELLNEAAQIRKYNLSKENAAGIDYISSGDFSFYDGILDTAFALNVIPARYKALGLSDLDTYFAMARGYQGEKGNVKALAMKKRAGCRDNYIFDEYDEALANGVVTKPVIAGPFTFLKLARFTGRKNIADYTDAFVKAYSEILVKVSEKNVKWIQFDEPFLVRDLTEDDKKTFVSLYEKILSSKGEVKVLLQTYFGDVRDIYSELTGLSFDGIGLDFVEGREK